MRQCSDPWKCPQPETSNMDTASHLDDKTRWLHHNKGLQICDKKYIAQKYTRNTWGVMKNAARSVLPWPKCHVTHTKGHGLISRYVKTTHQTEHGKRVYNVVQNACTFKTPTILVKQVPIYSVRHKKSILFEDNLFTRLNFIKLAAHKSTCHGNIRISSDGLPATIKYYSHYCDWCSAISSQNKQFCWVMFSSYIAFRNWTQW